MADTLQERLNQLPKATVKTLALASPVTQKIWKAKKYDFKLMRHHNIDPKLWTIIKLAQYSCCLYCGNYFFTVEKATGTMFDNRQYFCTSHCRGDWAYRLVNTLELAEKQISQTGDSDG